MQIRMVSKSDKTVELEFEGENETLLNLLKQRLLADPSVKNASFVMGHPIKARPHLAVEVASGKPEQAVRNAAKELRAEFDDFETQLVRSA
ncbi:MAG: RpoL/Rpb11 RNA polymerase subunit family protein [Thermoplasmatota archaeon]